MTKTALKILFAEWIRKGTTRLRSLRLPRTFRILLTAWIHELTTTLRRVRLPWPFKLLHEEWVRGVTTTLRSLQPPWTFKLLLAEWILGGALTLLFLLSYLGDWRLLQSAEYLTYDLRAQWWDSPTLSEEIVIVGVDEESLVKVGRWPWPRNLVGKVIEQLRRSGAKVIGVAFPVSEPDYTQGIEELRAIEKKVVTQREALATVKELREMRKKFIAPSRGAAAPRGGAVKTRDVELRLLKELYSGMLQDLREAQARLDPDTKLAAVLVNSPQAILPIFLEVGEPAGKETEGPSSTIVANAVGGIANPIDLNRFPLIGTRKLTPPLPVFQKEGIAVGHMTVLPDADGVVRRELLLLEHRGHFYPSFALRAAGAYLGVPSDAIRVTLGSRISVGPISIPTDRLMRMPISFNGPAAAFKTISAHHVLTGKTPPQAFQGKLVLVAPLATRITDRYPTPRGGTVSGVELAANAIQNMLGRQFVSAPPWAPVAELGMFLVAGFFMTAGLPRMTTGLGGLLGGLILFGYLGVAAVAFATHGSLITVAHPSLLLVLGYLLIATKRVVTSNLETTLVEEGAAKGLEQRLKRPKRLKKGGEGGVRGNGGPKRKEAEVMGALERGETRLRLGRYEIFEELGRGAMGVVYLGRDPKIHRFVAVKTIRLDQVDPDQLAEVKERFFREAESAGRLSHPNIVVIYDAGEEDDLGYIAMEILDGVALKERCRKDNLLPVKQVLEIVAKVAEALDYAHSQGIVHRDIKPSNIMLLKDGTVKVTDFGIARISTSSSTQTGILIGTPSYMSPQQLAGTQVDGRSDIFSLGVVLFELLTGEKPFQGESVTSLMFQIVNQPHTPPSKIRPDLPAECDAIIDRALHKDSAQRYQRGLDMARELHGCLLRMSNPVT